jgi:ferritin-like metal-binding protein YciE
MDMGLFGFGKKTSKVDKLVKKLTNAYLQTHDRIRVMEQLYDLGTDAALYGLLQRFTYRTEQSIVDEDEKETTYRMLVDAGIRAQPPIERFIAKHDTVYWPLRALRDIVGLDETVDVIMRALDETEGLDQRVNDHKTQLVSNLRDFPHARVEAKLVALSEDPDEEVRIMAVDGLLTYGPESALPPAARRILDADESPRVKTVILETLVEKGWSLGPWKKLLEESGGLPVPYRLSADGRIERGL